MLENRQLTLVFLYIFWKNSQQREHRKGLGRKDRSVECLRNNGYSLMHRYMTFLEVIFLPHCPGQLKYYSHASSPSLVSQASGARYCTPSPTNTATTRLSALHFN
jgi:hypothetical protein